VEALILRSSIGVVLGSREFEMSVFSYGAKSEHEAKGGAPETSMRVTSIAYSRIEVVKELGDFIDWVVKDQRWK
jgi:hypothetical protein